MEPLRAREAARPVPGLVVLADPAALAQEAAERFAGIAAKALARAGRFTVALTGGSTPKRLYTLLAAEPYRSRLPWPETHVFWGDERCVPPDHPESNYRMAHDALLRHLPIPPAQIHRMHGEDPDPERAAAEYEQCLRTVFAPRAGTLPRFDLVLLGMGADGHTASLFPHTGALREQQR
ncbi:MAG: 6-phosphogluconolactonase, partial [Gemmatimonadales bacterium]